MSDYVREKALRIPMSEEVENQIKNKYEVDYINDIENELFEYREVGKFRKAPTCESFLDYVLETNYGEDSGAWGKTRAITESEKKKYEPIFKKVLPGVDMDKVRLVEYCWYNCSEAPDYYDETKDDFYDEI